MSYLEGFQRFLRRVRIYQIFFEICRQTIILTCLPYIIWCALGSGGISIVPVLTLIGIILLTYVYNSLIEENIHLFFRIAEEIINDQSKNSKDS